ncbi:MAG: hypothetical protein KAR87_05315 [Candidatus Aenigmarchaeota archaeon]|nr:hypothetical protein [Candidatus Aenigmarchaeota archaeon]
MKPEMIFYITGGFFAIATLLYFAGEYILLFGKEIKLTILLCLTIIFYSAGTFLKIKDM